MAFDNQYGRVDDVVAIPGAFGDSGNHTVASYAVREADGISFGSSIFGYVGDVDGAYTAHIDTTTLVFDADFVALNSIVVTVNGVAGTAVVFDTDQATTMEALRVQIEADFEGITATRTDIAGDDRTMVLFLKGLDLAASAVVTLGASQPVATPTASSVQRFLGIAGHEHIVYGCVTEVIPYGACIGVVEYGTVWATETSEAVQAHTAAYVVMTDGADQGKIATSGYDTKAVIKTNADAGALVMLDVRGEN